MDARQLIKVPLLAAALIAGGAHAVFVADGAYGANGARLMQSFAGVDQSLVASASDRAGRLVAVGSIQQGGARDLLVARFLEDGGLDPTFGIGGLVQIDAGGSDEGLAVAVQPDGRIVVAGGRSGCALLVRLAADGALDPAFGKGGFLRVALLSGSAGRLLDVALDAQGRIVAVGSLSLGESAQSAAHPFVVRVGLDGKLDAAFDGDGVRVLREVEARAGALAIDAAQRVVVAGYWDAEYRLAALDPAGALDLSFGANGIAVVGLGQGALAADLLAAHGALFVAGINGAALVKLDAAGRQDAGFGHRGIANGALPMNLWSLAALPDGSVAVAGSCKAGASEGMLLGSFSSAGVFSAALCEANQQVGAFAEVRGLLSHAGGDLHGVAVRFEAGQVNAAAVRFVKQLPPPPAKCRKPKFAKKNPQLCGAP